MTVSLHHGDCLEVLKLIPSQSVDLVLTDPPYGTIKNETFKGVEWDNVIPFDKMWNAINRVIKKSSVVCLFGQEPFSSRLRLSNVKRYKYDWIWEKNQKGNYVHAKRYHLKTHELISVFLGVAQDTLYCPQFSKGVPYQTKKSKTKKGYSFMTGGTVLNKGVRYPTAIIKFNCERGLHPTQKPVKLLRYLIKTYTHENQTVLDFTMGSGSTGVAALIEKRNFIGIEKNDEYFKIASDRINQYKEKLDKK